MKVYRLRHDSNRFQFFMPKYERDAMFFYEFDGKPRKPSWTCPELALYSRKLKPGNFFQYSGGVLILDGKAKDCLEKCLESAGEILPFSCKGNKYYVFNVQRFARLDKATTKWENADPVLPGDIVEYGFKQSALKKLAVFKLRETATTEILVTEGVRDPEVEFRTQVHRHNLKGVLFELIWTDE